jgi:general secretion pathway protein L
MDRLLAAWRWWIDGLVDAVLLLVDRVGGRRRLRLEPVAGGGLVIVRPNGRRGRPGLRVVRERGEARLEPARLARRLAGRDVDVAVAAERCVVARLGPLPAESRDFLDDIVDHRLARLAPWPKADLLRVFRAEPTGEGDPRLMVRIDATSRAAVAPLLAALRAAGVARLRAVRLEEGRVAAVFPLAGEDDVRRRSIGRRVLFGLAAFVVLAGLATWRAADAVDVETARLDELEARIADYRRRLAPVGGGETQALTALARRSPMAVLTLEALSAALPDDTHLTELTIHRDRSSLAGLTRDVAELSRKLEASTVFAPPVFTADSVVEAGGVRFAMDLMVAPRPGAGR